MESIFPNEFDFHLLTNTNSQARAAEEQRQAILRDRDATAMRESQRAALARILSTV